MSFFGISIPARTRKIESEPAVAPQSSTLHFTLNELRDILGTSSRNINCATVEGQIQAMKACPVLSSVIIKKVCAIKNAKYWAVGNDDNPKEIPSNMRRILHPNPGQYLGDFVGMVELYMQMHGVAYIYCERPAGIRNDFDLYVVPNRMVVTNRVLNATPSFNPDADVESYTINFDSGATLKVSPQDMYLVRDVASSIGTGTSRMEPLQKPINTFIAAYESVNELMVNRGMLGIISLTSNNPILNMPNVPVTQEERDNIRTALQNYGTMSDQMKHLITNYNVGYTAVSSTITDLGLVDVLQNCRKDITDQYQVPSVLIDVEKSKYANASESKKFLYNDAIIPEANHILDVLNRIYGFEEVRVVPMFDHLEIFQQANREQMAASASLANALNTMLQNGALSREEVRDEWMKYTV